MSFTVKSNVNEVIEATDEAIETALDAVGMQAATLASREIQNSPSRIDTGLLRNSITWALGGKPTAISSYSADNPSKYTGKEPPPGNYAGVAPADKGRTKTVYIGTNVEYAVYVHEGTTKMTPNRFLKKALQNNVDEYKRILIDNLKH